MRRLDRSRRAAGLAGLLAWVALATLAGQAMLATSCTTEEQPRGGAVRPPSPPAPLERHPASHLLGGSEIAFDDGDTPFGLDTPCRDGGGVVGRCGARGVVVYYRLASVASTPCKLDFAKGGGPSSAGACVTADDRLYVVTRCEPCRLPGWTVAGVLAEMTDVELADAQALAGLSRSPLLRDGAAWQRALRAR